MTKLYKIGEISKMSDISVKTLRYYEDFGLIIPKEVDIYSGYRYYDDDNIETIYKIQALKDVGFSLQEIKDFDQESFKKKYKNIKKEIVALKKKLNIISYLMAKGIGYLKVGLKG